MIWIRVELWPHGDQSRCKELARVAIVNDGTGSETRGNYELRAFRQGTSHVQRNAELRNWPRKSQHVLSLLKQALDALGY